ncbi:hypothetical protein M0804_013235 [Polistes exclamans]|nr:hypothetical protein M0804_013235 [Polistes exclamans]
MDDKYIYIDIGHCLLRKFNPDSMDFLKWLNSLDYIFEILRGTDEQKVTFLLNMIEYSVLTTIIDALIPVDPFQLSYEELIPALVKMFSVYEGENAANYRFYTRVQLPLEPEKFINGLEDEETKTLLKQQDEDMTFAVAVGLAKQMELIKQEIKIIFN